MESDGRLCPAHRHRPVRPPPQGFGARAAFERDDRAATFGRVPRCLPGNRGNKTRHAVQAGGGIPHTSRTGGSDGGRAPSRVTAAQQWPGHMFPQRSRPSRTCSRSAAADRAIAGVQGDGGTVHALPRTHRGAAHPLPRRGGGRSTSRRAEWLSRLERPERMRCRSACAPPRRLWCGEKCGAGRAPVPHLRRRDRPQLTSGPSAGSRCRARRRCHWRSRGASPRA